MIKKILLIITFVVMLPSSAIAGVSVFGGQGYGAFRLSGADSVSLSSIMIAGIKFSEYFDFRYMSMDTSLRMPVLPFRIVDIKYNKVGDTYTAYDSDMFGLSFNIPFTSYFKLGLLYGLGKSKITSMTKQVSGDYSAIIHKGFMQALNFELVWSMPLDMLLISPKIGVITHFLDDKSGYNNAASYYLAVSLTYIFEKENQ